jgi:hypothetical protein
MWLIGQIRRHSSALENGDLSSFESERLPVSRRHDGSLTGGLRAG